MNPRTARPVPEKIAADHLRELLQGFTTTEKILDPVMRPVPTVGAPTKVNPWWEFAGHFTWTHHVVPHPSLLDQVEQTVTGSTTADDPVRGGRAMSKPAGRLDALAFLHRLEAQSRHLAEKHHVTADQPLRDRLSALSGVLGDRPHKVVKSWWATARVLTQHDSPPFAPNVPCPQEECEQRGTIRVRFDAKTAVCTACHQVWTDDDEDGYTFGRLAVWCDWASKHLHGHRHLVDREEADRLQVEHGYGEELGYVVVCPDCEFDRAGMAEREAVRLRRPRSYPVRGREQLAS